MNSFTRKVGSAPEEDLDQLEETAQFLEDLSTRVATDGQRRSCLDAARDFELAARRRKPERVGSDGSRHSLS